MKSPPIHKTRCSIIHLAECKHEDYCLYLIEDRNAIEFDGDFEDYRARVLTEIEARLGCVENKKPGGA